MSGFAPLWASTAGVRKGVRINDDGSIDIAMSQDVGDILDRNKAMANHNDGYTPSRDMRRAASIPASVRAKWLAEEGWDWFDCGHDPDVARRLMQKLNSSEWAHLRTASGHLGITNGVLR